MAFFVFITNRYEIMVSGSGEIKNPKSASMENIFQYILIKSHNAVKLLILLSKCLTEKPIGLLSSVFFCCAIVMLRLCNVGVYDERLHHNMTAGKAPAPILKPWLLPGFFAYGLSNLSDSRIFCKSD
ncbi:Uncharacterised protein [Yersinia rohdei]|nr:Uncharacterised protein [Yersinia rohdei]